MVLIERFMIHWKKIGSMRKYNRTISNKYSTTIHDRAISKDIIEINTGNDDANEELAIKILSSLNQEWYKLL